MRLTLVLTIAACLNASAGTYAQQVSLSVKNATLRQVFTAIEKQTGFLIFYNNDVLKETKPVTIDVRNASLEQVLKTILQEQSLQHSIVRKTIIIKKAPQPAEPPVPEVVQTPVNGIVRDTTGMPIVGVSIALKGTKTGTATNAEGKFSIDAAPGSVLVVSFIGYQPREVTVGQQTFLNIILRRSVSALDEMVVKGYYSTSRRLNTGAVGTVSAETIERQPVGNLLNALKGAVPGLDVRQSSGTPGAAVRFNIRGLNSIMGDNEPFILVDGVPLPTVNINTPDNMLGAFGGQSVFNSINPNDIESIEVLKDADATAIYGSRGANGVILITTKKGKAGKTEVGVNLYQGIGKVGTKTKMLDTRQYLDMRYEAFANDGVDWTAANVSAPDLKLWDTTRYTDWQQLLIGGTAHYTNAQVSLSGGNALTSFSFSGSYWKETTVYPGDFSDKRLSARFSLNHRSANDRLRFNLTNLYGHDFNQYPSFSVVAAYTLPPHAPAPYNEEGLLNWEGGSWSNPFAALFLTSEMKTHNLNTSAQASYRLLKHLWIKANAGYSRIDNDNVALQPKKGLNPFNTSSESRNDFRNTKHGSWNIEPYLEYEQMVWKGKLSVLLGTTFQERTTNTSVISGRNIVDDALIRNPAAADNIDVSGNSLVYRYNAVFGRVHYNVMNRYVLNLTGRRDGSSRFGPGRQFGNFGAVGLAWIFSEEEFAKKGLPFLSFGKLRGSYGTTGSDAIGDYEYWSTYSLGSASTAGGRGLRPDRLYNPYFHWESNTKFDAALELGFNKGELLVSANYYNNRSSNQLVGIPMPSMVGFGTLNGNINATVRNTGWEFNASSVNIKGKNFQWRTTANFTIPKNELVSYPNLEQSTHASSYAIGQSLSLQKVYNHVGVNPQTGINVYRDRNGKDTSFMTSIFFALADRVVMINAVPHFYGGLTNSFGFKDFTLDVMIQYSKRTRNTDIATLNGALPGMANNIPLYVYENSWRSPGDVSLFQKFTQATNTAAYRSRIQSSADAYYMDLHLLRLNNVSLSWKLPESWQKKLHASNARVYMLGQNLLTISNFKGVDPEAGTTALPIMRVFTAGVQISF